MRSLLPQRLTVSRLPGRMTCSWPSVNLTAPARGRRGSRRYYVLGKLPDQAIEDCTITDEKLDLSSVVEFTGDDLGVAIPEGQGQGGGRQVRVTHPGVIKPARQFAQENDFVIPMASNEINLDVPGEDDMEGG